MSNIRESEILHIDDLGNPTAISYDPGAFSDDTVRTILNNQISSPTPLEIHCYIRGCYVTIEAKEFTRLRKKSAEKKARFIERKLPLIKGLDNREVIFSRPLERWKSPL